MKTTSLKLKPSDILRKEAFRRAIPSQMLTQIGLDTVIGGYGSYGYEGRDPLRFQIYSQSDFLREYDANSHRINSILFNPDTITQDNQNKFYRKCKTRTAIAFQERIFVKRLTTLTGNNINIRIANYNSGKAEQEMLARYREGWETHNIENAIYEGISSDGKTGDCAICFYMSGKRVGWRSFGFEKGDILYPHYDAMTGELDFFGRKYMVTDADNVEVEYLDIWDSSYYYTFKFNTELGKTENGDPWELVSKKAHGFKEIPIAYDRYGEPFWANSQQLIDAYEMAISQFCENNMAYALRILFTLGGDMDLVSSSDGTPSRIESPDADAKVGFLEPADASNSFKLQLETLEKNIMRSSFAVETPEIKSGADMSSLTVKMLYADAYQKALEDAMHFQPWLDKIAELFKYGYGIETGMVSDFNKFKVKAEIAPYIFMSETEQVSNMTQLVTIGAMSKKSASEHAYELGYGVIGEYARVTQEEHDALVAEGQIPQNTLSALNKETNNPVNILRKAQAEA